MRRLGMVWLSFAASACAPQAALQPPAPAPAADLRAEPPAYVRLFEREAHPRMNMRVRANFPPASAGGGAPGGASLQTALTAALPFPVSVSAADPDVDLGRPVAVRADGVTVAAYLAQLEGETGYRITLDAATGVVRVASVETRSWNLSALAGLGSFRARLGFDPDDADDDGESGGGASGGFERSHALSAQVAHDDRVWDDLVRHANCILRTAACGDGAAADAAAARAWVTDNRRLGTITASGAPPDMARLNAWLARAAQDSSRLIYLECAILDIGFDLSRSTGVDLRALLAGADGALSLAHRLGRAVEDPDGRFAAGAQLRAGDFSLDALIENLSRHADVRVKSRVSFAVTNGATAYLNTGEVFSYISKSETISTEVGVETSASQSRVQVGLQLAVTPRLLGRGDRMLLEVTPALSSVPRFDTLDDAGTRAPVISLRQMNSQAITSSGRPIAVGGLSWRREARQAHAPARALPPFDRLFRGARSESETRELLVVITPWEVSG